MKNIKISVLLIFLFICNSTTSQDLEKLRKERVILQKEIENIQKQLDANTTSTKDVLTQLNLLNNEINKREELIGNLKKEVDVLNLSIEDKQQKINILEKNISETKKEYIKLLQDSYIRHTSKNELLFFLSAKDFSEAYHRHRILKEYSSYRKTQGLMLVDNQNKLKILLQNIQSQRNEKESTLNNLENEKLALNKTQNQKKRIIEELKEEEKSLKQSLIEKDKQAKVLDNKIQEYIKKSGSKKSEYGKEFKDNRGKLIWPIIKGTVISDFGEHEHPVIKGIIIKNNGIDIKSSNSEDVVNVFTGEVSTVFSIPGYNNAIIIRHGDYLTVYANLKEVYVKQGQKLETNTKIGKLYKDIKEDHGVLHFEIRKGNQKLNPIEWLKMQ